MLGGEGGQEEVRLEGPSLARLVCERAALTAWLALHFLPSRVFPSIYLKERGREQQKRTDEARALRLGVLAGAPQRLDAELGALELAYA